jgi:hypothetical protein
MSLVAEGPRCWPTWRECGVPNPENLAKEIAEAEAQGDKLIALPGMRILIRKCSPKLPEKDSAWRCSTSSKAMRTARIFLEAPGNRAVRKSLRVLYVVVSRGHDDPASRRRCAFALTSVAALSSRRFVS